MVDARQSLVLACVPRDVEMRLVEQRRPSCGRRRRAATSSPGAASRARLRGRSPPPASRAAARGLAARRPGRGTGFVARTMAKRSYCSGSRSSVNVIHSMSGEVEVAYSAGRRKGPRRRTSGRRRRSPRSRWRRRRARTRRTAARSRSRRRAAGDPASGRMFLSATRSEPERAPMRAITLGMLPAAPRVSAWALPGGGRRGRRRRRSRRARRDGRPRRRVLWTS